MSDIKIEKLGMVLMCNMPDVTMLERMMILYRLANGKGCVFNSSTLLQVLHNRKTKLNRNLKLFSIECMLCSTEESFFFERWLMGWGCQHCCPFWKQTIHCQKRFKPTLTIFWVGERCILILVQNFGKYPNFDAKIRQKIV